MDVELVSEIRSPATCLKTFDYLMQRLDHDEFDFLHSWIWDRTRAIRKDLRTQRIEQRSEINILLTTLERSARFYLLSTHQMARTKKTDYSYQQDIEQLNQTLMSLKERYDDNRRVGYPSENEAEFWAYRLILAPIFTNSQYENELQGVPSHLRNNPRVQVALEIHRAMKSVIFTRITSFVQAQANWKRFWEIVKSPSVSYLMACAAEVSFQRVRHVILDALWRVYRMGTTKRPRTVETWTMDQVTEVLGLDTEAEAFRLCEAYGFSFGQLENGQQFLDVCAKGYERTVLSLPADLSPHTFSQAIVEVKRCDRAFSAVVRAMSVQQADNHGSMVDSTTGVQASEQMDDEHSLFVPEASATKPSIFPQANGTTTKSTLAIPAASDPSTNPFIKNAASAFQAFPGLGSADIQPGVFDPSKNNIKFASFETTTTPFANTTKSTPFTPTTSTTQANTPTTTNGAPAAGFNFFSQAAKTQATQPAAATPTTSTTQANTPTTTNGAPAAGFNFFSQAAKTQAIQPAAATPTTASNRFGIPRVSSGASQVETRNIAPSFTPVGSPAPQLSTSQEEAKRKAEEEERQRKAEAEAAVQAQQQQRAREEEARQAREVAERKQGAERQRLEAEQERQRIQQAEHHRLVQEARQRQQREDEARLAKLQARKMAYTSLTSDVMWDNEQGLMFQFIENLVANTAEEVIAAEEEKKKRILEEKRLALLNAIYEQRELAFKRSVMATWIAKVEKKKRARQVKDRRRRLKEQKARMMNMEENSTVPPQEERQATANQTNHKAGFQKPQAPASARRAKRTEERRGVKPSQQNGIANSQSRLSIPEQQAAAQTVLTPVSMSNSLGSSAGYSEAYQKSTAPIDRTETDYFILRAQGLDPSKHRKRSFDSSSGGEEQLAIEPKRPKLSSPEPERPSPPQMTTTEEHEARLRALQQRRFEKSGGPQPPVNIATTSSPAGRVRSLVHQAQELIGPSSPKPSPPNLKHDYGRSVPSSGLSASSVVRQSLLGKSIGTATTIDRPAFYGRKSRFVPQHLYGHGGEAARAYRKQLNSPPGTRPNSIEPLAASSPIPTQMSYLPQDGYTQEEYSEEDVSGAEMIDADAEDEDVASTEEEYESDEETEEEEDDEEEEPEPRRLSNHYHYKDDEDEDGDSAMSGNDLFNHNAGYMNGGRSHYEEEGHGEFEGYTDEDGAMEDGSGEDSETQQEHFAQPAQRGQSVQPAKGGKKAQPPVNKGGNTEDDAIELSD